MGFNQLLSSCQWPFPLQITQLPLTRATSRARPLWIWRLPLLPVSRSFIRPASCLLNLYGLFHPPIHEARQYPLRERGQRLTTATRARGFFYGAKLVSHSPPRLKSCSWAKKTHFWPHTKSASERVQNNGNRAGHPTAVVFLPTQSWG